MPVPARLRAISGRQRVPAAVLSLALVVALAACTGEDDGSRTEGLGVQQPEIGLPKAPEIDGRSVADLVVERADGAELRLGEYAGRPLVVNFYGRWCEPCERELPAFEAVHQELGGDVAFLGVAVPPNLDGARTMATEAGVTYDLAEDPDGGAIAELEGTTLPFTALVRADGTVADVQLRELSAERLRSLIDEHLRP